MEELVLSSTRLPIVIVRHVILRLAWDSHVDTKLKQWFLKQWTRYLQNRDFRLRNDGFDHLICVRPCIVCLSKREDRKKREEEEAKQLKLGTQSKDRHQEIIKWVQSAKQKRRHSIGWRKIK